MDNASATRLLDAEAPQSVAQEAEIIVTSLGFEFWFCPFGGVRFLPHDYWNLLTPDPSGRILESLLRRTSFSTVRTARISHAIRESRLPSLSRDEDFLRDGTIQPTGQERFFPEDEIIVNETDVKGRISYVNQTFMTVSDYTEEDLLVRPHSIVRHPDMPRCVFKLLWDTLKASGTDG